MSVRSERIERYIRCGDRWLKADQEPDAVQVVRCERCKHSEPIDRLRVLCRVINRETNKRGYCYYGEEQTHETDERKTDGSGTFEPTGKR